MHIIREEEDFISAVIPSSSRGKHVIVLPHIGCTGERGEIEFGLVLEVPRLYKHRIGKHVHIDIEGERLDLGVVGSCTAFNNLSVLVAHGSSIHEDSQRILSIIVQMSGPQRIVILVGKLHDRSPELRKILLDKICQLVTGKDSFILDDAHLAPGLYDFGLHIPQGRITYKIGIVMKETCRPDHLPVAGTCHIHHLG